MIKRHSSLLRSANLGWQLREACGAILVVVMLAIIVPGVATGQSGGGAQGAPQPAGYGSGGTSPSTLSDITVRGVVFPLREIEVPAPVTGQLETIHVHENVLVVEDTVLAQVDDEQARTAKLLAEARLHAAQLEANDDSAILEAEATYELAKKELSKFEQLFQKDATSEFEVEQARLSRRQAELRLQNRRKQQELAIKRLEVSQLELQEADQQIKRFQVTSKTMANVQTIYRREGEWVKEGDPVMRLVRMDRLKVEAQVPSEKYNREDLHSHRVTVVFQRARGETVQFQGKIIYTGLRETASKMIQVRAEVDNQIVADHWVLHPGADVTLIIHPDKVKP